MRHLLLAAGLLGLFVEPLFAAPALTTAPSDMRSASNLDARVVQAVPADAEVFFDGKKTRQTGIIRRFSTPPLTPGTIGPWRSVPAHIRRPEYVGKKRPRPYSGPHVQTPETIEKMRVTGRLAAQATQLFRAAASAGMLEGDDLSVVRLFEQLAGL